MTSTHEDDEAKKSSGVSRSIVKRAVVFTLPFLLMLGIAGTGFLFNFYLQLFKPPRYWD